MLEAVAHRRAVYFGQVENWREYEVLAAVEDCELIGRSGWIIADEVKSVIVVDCEADVHQGQMASRGLMADVSLGEVGMGWLVLR